MTAATQETDLPEVANSAAPNRWQKLRIKNLLREADERSKDGEGMLLSLSRTRGLIPYSSETGRPPSAANLIGYKICRPGQIVMNRMQAWSGVFAISHHIGVVSPDYAVFNPTPLATPEYLIYLLRSPHLVSLFAAESKGIGTGFNRLYTERFGAIPVALPDVREQQEIARYLAFQDQKMVRLVANKRRLIALLNEEKQAIIQQAVTRGLDPDVPMKPSGVEWLEEIPAHWELLPFLRCVAERADYRGATPEKVDSGIQLLTAKNIRVGWIDYESSKEFVRVDDYHRIMRRGLPRTNDILFTMEAPLGNAALVDREDIALAQRVVRFRMDEQKMLPDFAIFSLLAPYFQQQLQLRATGSTASGIKASKLPQLLVISPPIHEQSQVVEKLKAAQGEIDQAVQRVTREIDLIREFRTRLIADVVTGQLDVREAAASLPDTDFHQSQGLMEEADQQVQEYGSLNGDDLVAVAVDDFDEASLN